MIDKNNNKPRSVWSYMIDGVRLFFWPRGGWRKTFRYVMRQLARMPSSPYAIAIGFAAGAFISFTPFLGFHFLLAAGIAWVLRGNVIASALGTMVGNPLTFPFIWVGAYVVGTWILEGQLLSFSDVTMPETIAEFLKEYAYVLIIGGVPLGLVGGFITFLPIYILVHLRQRRKKAND